MAGRHATLSEVIHVQKLGLMAHCRMLAGRGIMGEITIRQPRYKPFLRGSAGVFEFCMTFCWSTVDSRVRPWTTAYRAQTSYGLSRLCLACFGGVTGQRSN